MSDTLKPASTPKSSTQGPVLESRRGYRGGGLPPRDGRERALAIHLYEHTATPLDSVAELMGVPRGTVSRWWRRWDEEHGAKPPHRGGRGQDPVDRAALAEARAVVAEALVSQLSGELASLRQAAGEGPAGRTVLLIAQTIDAIERAIPLAKPSELPPMLKALREYREWEQSAGASAENPAAAIWEDLKAGLAAIPRPATRPCDLGLVDDAPVDLS